MDNKITPFTFNDIEVRVITRGGAPWWVAADVAHALGYRDAGRITRYARDHQKGSQKLCTLGGSQELQVINEAGLYMAIMKSHSPHAEKFQDWVTEEVLPAIRSHGGYLTPEATAQALSDPDFIIRLATQLKEERAQRLELETRVEEAAPKVLFADAVSASTTSILVGDLAKIIKGNCIDIGANRLFTWLRAHGYLTSRRGADWNSPTQKAMELGLFEIKETVITHADGHITVNKTPKVTGKGQQYFISRFLDGRFNINDTSVTVTKQGA